MQQKILILGGGFAGLYAARELRKRLGPEVEIELVSAENYFVFQPLLPEVAGGSITAPHAVTPLRFLLPGVFVRKARVDGIDTARKIVTVFQGVQRRPTELAYDHLVIALGSEVDLTRTPGLADHAMTMKSLEDARQLRSHVIEKLEHANITGLPDVKREALSFVVVGAGFSGIETVGEMRDLIDRSLPYYPNISADEVRVTVVEFANRVLGELPEKLGIYAKERLEARGVEILLGRGVASATGTRLMCTDGTEIPTRTIVATIGNAPPTLLSRIGLEVQAGRVKVDRSLRAEGQDAVWSLGDCALIPMKEGASERADFAPPTAQFAVREARTLAENIAATLACRPVAPFQYASKGAMASLGGRRGVAEVMGVQIRGYLAWLLWRFYYVGFLPGFGTKLRVLVGWLFDALLPRPMVQLHTRGTAATRRVHYTAGDRIFEAGNRPDGVYAILSGAVEATYPNPETGDWVARRLEAGETFGERVLLGGGRRTGTAKALEDCQILVIAPETFEDFLQAFPTLQGHFRTRMKEVYGVDWPVLWDGEG